MKILKETLTTDGEEFILFIIDRDMSSVKEEKDAILSLLDCIKNNLKVKKFMVIVYTNEPISDINSLESKKVYLEDNEEELSYICLIHPISKTSEEEVVQTKFKEFLLESYVYANLYNHLEEKKKLDKKIYDGIYFSEIFDFKSGIINAKESGDTVGNLLSKAFKSIHNIKSIEIETFIESRKDLNIASNVYAEKENRVNEIDLISEHTIHTMIDMSINAYYKDIYTGDLFEFKNFKGIKQYGLVISKSCHTIIRNGERSAKKLRLLILEEEVTDSKNKKNKAIKKLKVGQCIWPFKYDITTGSAISLNPTKDNHILIVDSKILDLCTLNTKGEALVDIKTLLKDALKYKPHYSAEYFKKFDLSSSFDKDLKSIIGDVGSGKIEELNYHIISKTNNISYNKGSKKFELQRIGRLTEDRTLALYQNFLSQLATPGVEEII